MLMYLKEISIKDKYDIEIKNGKTKLPFWLYEKLCSIDPTSRNGNAGKFCNWLISHYIEGFDEQNLKVALEQFSDGLRRGILKQNDINPDINSYKTYNELIEVMERLMNNANTTLSKSEYNNRVKLEGQYDSYDGGSKTWEIIAPHTYEAERYFGSNSKWCTVGDKSYFDSYMKEGQLYIIYPKNGDSKKKMQFHVESGSYATHDDTVYDSPRECILAALDTDEDRAEVIALCSHVFKKDIEENGFDMHYTTLQQAIDYLKGDNSDPRDIFDNIHPLKGTVEGDVIALFYLNGKCGLYSITQHKILTNETYASITFANEGLFIAENKDEVGFKCTYLKSNGERLTNEWFDRCAGFKEGIARVIKNGKFTYIRKDGTYLVNEVFDDAEDFDGGRAVIGKNNEDGSCMYNFINTNGAVILKDWVSYIYQTMNGFVVVVDNAEKKFCYDKGMNMVGNTEMKYVDGKKFYNLGSMVQCGKLFNFIDTVNRIQSMKWFDYINFNNDTIEVGIGGKSYYIDIYMNLYDHETHKCILFMNELYKNKWGAWAKNMKESKSINKKKINETTETMNMNQEELKALISELDRESNQWFPSREENSVVEVLNAYFFDYDNWDYEKEKIPNIKVTRYGLSSLAHVLIDYDFIMVLDDGTVNKEESNAPKIADIASKLIPADILLNARRDILGENKKIRNSRSYHKVLFERITRKKTLL